MSQPLLPPGWADTPTEEKTATFRFNEEDRQRSRMRGGRRGLKNRFALRALPPIDEDNPEDFGV